QPMAPPARETHSDSVRSNTASWVDVAPSARMRPNSRARSTTVAVVVETSPNVDAASAASASSNMRRWSRRTTPDSPATSSVSGSRATRLRLDERGERDAIDLAFPRREPLGERERQPHPAVVEAAGVHDGRDRRGRAAARGLERDLATQARAEIAGELTAEDHGPAILGRPRAIEPPLRVQLREPGAPRARTGPERAVEPGSGRVHRSAGRAERQVQ